MMQGHFNPYEYPFHLNVVGHFEVSFPSEPVIPETETYGFNIWQEFNNWG